MPEQIEYCRQCSNEYLAGVLSKRGYCPTCSTNRLLDSIQQMRDKDGPLYKKWALSYIAAMSGVLDRLRKEL